MGQKHAKEVKSNEKSLGDSRGRNPSSPNALPESARVYSPSHSPAQSTQNLGPSVLEEKIKTLEAENEKLKEIEVKYIELQKQQPHSHHHDTTTHSSHHHGSDHLEVPTTEIGRERTASHGSRERKESHPLDHSGHGSDFDDSPPPSNSLLIRQRSLVEEALHKYRDETRHTIRHLLPPKAQQMAHPENLPETLHGCYFVGHTATDMDSIGSAIAAAELFSGVATRASDINSETKFALEYWNVELPPLFKDAFLGTEEKKEEEAEQTEPKDKFICLVDHNQISQMAEGVDLKCVKGCIDHHALQSGTIVSDLPIYVNIKPWGSACTIIAHMFLQEKRAPTRKVAGLLLSGILSDTLNLHSPTTTEADKLVVSLLAAVAGVHDADGLAQKMFKAKSKDLLTLTPHQLIRGDLKLFKFTYQKLTYQIAFGVVETVDLEGLLGRKDEMIFELKAFKAEKKVQFAFLAAVDIVGLVSRLCVCGEGEKALAEKTFGGVTTEENLLDLGKRVSRKKDFIPPLSDVLQSGWTPPPGVLEEDKTDYGEVVVECGPVGCALVRRPSRMPKMPAMMRASSLPASTFSSRPTLSGVQKFVPDLNSSSEHPISVVLRADGSIKPTEQ